MSWSILLKRGTWCSLLILSQKRTESIFPPLSLYSCTVDVVDFTTCDIVRSMSWTTCCSCGMRHAAVCRERCGESTGHILLFSPLKSWQLHFLFAGFTIHIKPPAADIVEAVKQQMKHKGLRLFFSTLFWNGAFVLNLSTYWRSRELHPPVLSTERRQRAPPLSRRPCSFDKRVWTSQPFSRWQRGSKGRLFKRRKNQTAEVFSGILIRHGNDIQRTNFIRLLPLYGRLERGKSYQVHFRTRASLWILMRAREAWRRRPENWSWVS